MTSALLTPWGRRRQAAAARADAPRSTAPSAILDVGHLAVVDLVQSVLAAETDLLRLRDAHRAISGQVRAVHSVKDHQPVSRRSGRFSTRP